MCRRGEIVIFDRSWYNGAGVERVIGFCSEEGGQALSQHCAASREGHDRLRIGLIKYWLEVSAKAQERRLQDRTR